MLVAPKNYQFRRETKTIRDFVLAYASYDVQPVGQRLSTQLKLEGTKSKPSKAQGIIASIMMGMNIGEITLRDLAHESASNFLLESIDGGHRKRTIKAFFENKFKDVVTGKYFSELPEEVRKQFLDYDLTFVIYENLSSIDAGKIFRALNETTQVNHQEMLNSYGDIPVANAIREMTRTVAGVDNDCHELFEYTLTKDEKKSYKYLNFDNMRLRQDEIVARVFARYLDNGQLGVADDKTLEDMYEATYTDAQLKKAIKQVTALFDHLRKVAVYRKQELGPGLSQEEFSLHVRLYMYMSERFGEFKVDDYHEFFKTVFAVSRPFFAKQANMVPELLEASPYDKNKTKGQNFKNALGEHRREVVIRETLGWLVDGIGNVGGIDFLSLITVKDKNRLFSREDREAKLAEQGFKCAIDGQPLIMKDAAGDHIIPHSKGGKTTYENLAMVRKEYNQEMSSMDITLDQYRELKGMTVPELA